MGYIEAQSADLFVARDGASGLVGVLNGRPLKRCLLPTRVDNLDVLPAIGAKTEHIGRLSGRMIRDLIAQAAPDYDTLLFDTGSVPGSVEALLVTGSVEGVVIVTARGERQRDLIRTLSNLRLVGAHVIGTVANQVGPQDLHVRISGDPAGSGGQKESWPAGTSSGSGIFAAAVDSQSPPPPEVPPARPGGLRAIHSVRPAPKGIPPQAPPPKADLKATPRAISPRSRSGPQTPSMHSTRWICRMMSLSPTPKHPNLSRGPNRRGSRHAPRPPSRR